MAGKPKMVSLNKGPMVGGPYDGGEYDVLLWPPDWPDWPDGVPRERLEVRRVFSRNFPEGAVYHWDGASWIYQGPMDAGGEPGEHRRLFDAFGIETEPPL